MSESNEKWLRIKQITKLIPVGESTWWRWVSEGRVPAPIKLGPKTSVWRSDDIKSFMRDVEVSQDD